MSTNNIFLGLFFIAGYYVHKGWVTDVRGIFIAMFGILFGAMGAGQSATYGPDFQKALTAAKRIFTISDIPSHINALEVQMKGESDKSKPN